MHIERERERDRVTDIYVETLMMRCFGKESIRRELLDVCVCVCVCLFVLIEEQRERERERERAEIALLHSVTLGDMSRINLS